MTQYFQYNEPLLIVWRDGSGGDPYVSIDENNLEIVYDKIILREIPSELDHIQISGGHTEIFSGAPATGQFITDYSLGICTFNDSENGTVISTASYVGRGQISYPAEKIYLYSSGTSVQTYLENLSESIENLNESNLLTLLWMGMG